MNIINLLFGFDGRIRRLPWWLGTIAIEIVVAVLNQLFGIPVESAPAAMTPRIVALVITLVSLYPLMALAVKRLHDRDHPARWPSRYWWLFLSSRWAICSAISTKRRK